MTEEHAEKMTMEQWEAMTDRQKTLWLEENKPANKNSLGHRGEVYGVGVNDAPYLTQPVIESKGFHCPAHQAWKGMIERGYCPKFKASRPTYEGVTVCDEWHSFMTFRAWWLEHQRDGWQMDKDLLIAGNKVYSPASCCFVPIAINNLLLDRAAARGNLPLGVNRARGGYRAQIRINSKRRHLGCFHTPDAAHWAYSTAKLAHVMGTTGELEVPADLWWPIRDQVVSRFPLVGESENGASLAEVRNSPEQIAELVAVQEDRPRA